MRALISTAALLAALGVLFGGAGGAGAAAMTLCTTTTSAPTATPATVTAGTSISYTATVTTTAGCANGTPTGTVAFYSNYLVNGQPTSFEIGSPVTLQATSTPGQAKATLVDNSLPAGSFQITASYTSDNEPLFYDSASATGTNVVIQSAALPTPKMDFTLSPSSITVGQSVNLYVHITPVDASGNPTGAVATGTVHFSAGPAAGSGQFAFDSIQLDSSGSVSFSYNGFVAGDYVVVASYSGDPQDQSVSGQLPLHVAPAASPIATATTVVASPSSMSVGQTTTLQAHVVETAAQTPAPAGGTVNFYAGPSPASLSFEGVGTLDANGDATLSGVGNVTAGQWTVEASYLGDGANNVGGSSGTNTLFVSTASTAGGGAFATQTGYVGTTEAAAGAAVTLTGQLEDGQGHGVAGEPLTLSVGTQSCVTPNTVGDGTASCTVTLAQPAGSVTATAAFLGDQNWQASSGSAPFTIDQAATGIVYTGAISAAYGSSATLSATLTDGNGNPIGGETVHFTMGSQSCDGVTDGNGDASCSITVSQNPDSYSVSASFAGDSTYAGSGVAKAPFTVTGLQTTTTYTGATQSIQGGSATLSAHVAGAPDGGTVAFAVGAESCSGTIAGGNASCTVTISDAPGGGYTVTATYAGDAAHSGSSDSQPFTVVSPTTTTHIAPISPVLAGSPVTLSATVSPASAPGTVTFSSGATTLCSAALSGGSASCSATFAQSGSYPVTARYGGGGGYPASSDSTTALVYAFAPGGGSFVVGDKTASGAVTFWGAQWWKVNVLSGGPAPAAFKGFALNGATCGGTWSTDPGNSSPPPDGPLPAYMAVLVTSNTLKVGPGIFGNTVAIVIVQTSPGYRDDPGHAGTGTVVATLCTGPGTLRQPASSISYTGATSGSTGSSAALSATLTDGSGHALAGEPVTLSLGAASCTAKTDPKGNAACTVDVTQGAGTYPVTASFAGDGTYAPSSASSTFTVTSPGACSAKGAKCESLLADPSQNGSTVSLVYMDDSAIKSAAATVNGQSAPVAIASTSAQPQDYVDTYGGSKSTKYESLLTVTLPSAGTYTVVVTAYDGDGELDQFSWTVTV